MGPLLAYGVGHDTWLDDGLIDLLLLLGRDGETRRGDIGFAGLNLDDEGARCCGSNLQVVAQVACYVVQQFNAHAGRLVANLIGHGRSVGEGNYAYGSDRSAPVRIGK